MEAVPKTVLLVSILCMVAGFGMVWVEIGIGLPYLLLGTGAFGFIGCAVSFLKKENKYALEEFGFAVGTVVFILVLFFSAFVIYHLLVEGWWDNT